MARSDLLRVGLLTLRRFENACTGQGIPRYVGELYRSMEKISASRRDLELRKIVIKSVLWEAPSFYVAPFFEDLSGLDIIHNPIGFLRMHHLPRKSKYVVTVHDVNPLPQRSLKWRTWYRMFVVPGLKHTMEKADAIIVNSTQTRGELVAEGCERSKIRVIPLGVNDSFLKASRRRHGRKNGFTVGYLGSFAINKNVEFMIDAAKYLKGSGIMMKLWGNKDLTYNELSSRAKGLKNMRFMGFVPEDKLVSTYDSFDAFAFPSRYEGFGLPILEAQARGLPVIIYKHSVIPREVRKYCFEADDPEHMARIIEGLKEYGYDRARMERAMKYARSFTWKRAAQETLECYRRIA